VSDQPRSDIKPTGLCKLQKYELSEVAHLFEDRRVGDDGSSADGNPEDGHPGRCEQ
jgi:hypothetical protein